VTPYYQDDLVTIYHGDAREIAPRLVADACVTDPPYGINAMDKQHGASSGPVLSWDTEYPHDIINALAARMPVAAFGAAKTIARELAAFDPTPRVAVWNPRFRLGMVAKDGLAYRWTPIYLFGVKVDGPTIRDVFDEPTEAGSPYNHPSAKPVALMRAVVAAVVGDTILDPFAGSGTTLRAAKDLGRRAIGIEIEERYCEIAANRCRQEVLGLTA
jgi:DNA modification methylase